MSVEAWIPPWYFTLLGCFLFLTSVPCTSSMEVTVLPKVSVLNGTTARLSCTFTSCYKPDNNLLNMNWTYRGCINCSEEMFLQFKRKIINLKLEQFKDRVTFVGNPSKNDFTVNINDIQLTDEGNYTCYVLNPPDRNKGSATIQLTVVTEVPPKRSNTVAVVVGASVGGFLAVVILILVVVKCVRRKKKQELNSEDQKTEEEGKTDGEGNPEEGTKQ
ncbi:sodium channel subunit beta-2 [Protopterus annectens]|uniref:sodium channel subunit beta-2 n=1 Tax=Protopterus annectens TaxID=7888 RepID=UPI001CFAE4B6|nr:sodium channel subunit beta-2 [Protopterus annectens]